MRADKRLWVGAILALMLTLTGCGLVRIEAVEPTVAFPTLPAAAPTAIPTLIPTASATLEPTPTATPMHPLMIEAMRQRDYPGSEIVFEQTLIPTTTYDQFVVSYQSEGNKIYALMTIPRGDRPATGWPVIVFNHGYIAPNIYRTTERYVAYVDAFAQHGYIVFKSDYRGHGSSEGSAVGAYGSPAYTTDVLNAVASLKQYPDVDVNRIGMWGHSMGGQITLRAMVVSRDIKAGVIWGGVVASYPDLMKYWFRGPRDGTITPTPDPNTTRGSWRRSMVEVYGYPEDNPEFWAAISPNSYLDEISGPVQLHHSIEDETVPVILSELLYGELRDAGIVAQLWTYENDNHNISNHFSEAMQHSIQWFDAFVKGEQ